MSDVKRNVVANYVGQAWGAIIGVVFLPIYIRYIGIEGFGVIGFFVALQSLFSILDLGLSATLTRELAVRSQTTLANETRDLVRTLEWIYWPMGGLIALAVWGGAQFLAEHWLRPVALSTDQTANALLLLGMAAALQWPVSFYTGGLAGLQRQVVLNVMSVSFSTIRAVGAVLVLLAISPTLHAFLWWQIAVSALQTAVYAVVTWRLLPPAESPPAFSKHQLTRIGRFAIGISGTTVVSFLLTQTDRFVLSKILSLDAFGVYAFAASLAFALLRLVYPLASAVFPRYSQLVAADDAPTLVDFYHRTNQLMSVAIVPVAATVAMFACDLIWLWTGDADLARAAAPILALLIVGTAANGLMNLPYSLQLAYGWTSLAFWINVVAVCVLVPAIVLLGQQYGGVGAASAWLALNLAYIAIGIPLMHRRLLSHEMWRWYVQDIGPSVAASVLIVAGWRVVVPVLPHGLAGWGLLLFVLSTAIGGCLLATQAPRRMLRRFLSAN